MVYSMLKYSKLSDFEIKKYDEIIKKSSFPQSLSPQVVSGDRESFLKTGNDSEQVGMTEKCFLRLFTTSSNMVLLQI